MKTTHKNLLRAALVALFALPLFSCTNEKLLSDLEDRVSQLETLCARMQTNLDSAAPLLEALASQDYITDVTPLTEGQKVTGYIIKFAHGNPITIYNGANGNTPDITIRQAEDGNWYWNVDDRWMRDDNGDKIPAKGVTPQLKVEGGAWYASFDGGKTWEPLEVNSGSILISSIEESSNQVVFVLSDGSRITFPKGNIIPMPDQYLIAAPDYFYDIAYPLPNDGRTYRAAAYVIGYDSDTQNYYKGPHQQFYAEAAILEPSVHSVVFEKLYIYLETPQIMPTHFEVHVDVFSKGASDEEFRIVQSINLPFERLITDNNKPEVVYVSSEAQTIALGAQTNVDASTIQYYEQYDWISIDETVTTRADLHTEQQYLAFAANTDRLPRMAKVSMVDRSSEKELREFLILQVGTETNITFADSEVKNICVKAFDKDRDGEVSYQEALAASIIKDRETFKNNTTIKEFNELKYFMNLHSSSLYFEGCSSLEYVELPPFMTKLNPRTFYKCSSLKQIQLPATLKTIGNCAFWGTGLREIVIPAGIESFGSACFKDCTHLTSFRTETPIKIGEIPESMFENCTSLAYVGDIEAESIGDRAFMNADLSDIALVKATNRYGDYAFYNTNIRYNRESSNGNRDFGLYCNSIGSHCFENCDSLRPETIYMSQECPPALGKDAFKLREGKIQLLRLGFHENYLYRYLEAGWDAYFETIKAGVEFVDVTINIGGGWD